MHVLSIHSNPYDLYAYVQTCICTHICIYMSYIFSVHIQATMRTWKQYYTVLSGPELCFYKDRKDFQQVITNLLSCYVL